jgi:single-stranded-DNA-specific exonuclease
VVEDPELMRGMTGFLSFRLSRFLNRPVAVVSCKDGVISGSIRISGDGADALELLTLASDLIMTSGGNQSAGEFVAEKQIIGELQQCWSGSSYTAKNVRHRSRPDGALDADLHTSELTPALDRLIDNFEPTGLGSEQLVFRTRGLQVAEVSLVGHSSEHCKLLLDSGTYRWPAFYWRGGATVAAQIVSGDIVDVIYRLEIGHGDGERRLHMVVLDLFQGDK